MEVSCCWPSLVILAQMLLEALLTGISLGLVLALLIGPVFFLLIDTGISKGFRASAFIAGGVIFSDALFVILAYFSSTATQFIQEQKQMIGFIGGAILVVFGIITILRKPVIHTDVLHLRTTNGDHIKGAWKGFILNFLNPFVLIFWMGIAGSLVAADKPQNYAVPFFSAALATVFFTDLLKGWGAAKLKRLIRPSYLLWLNRLSGTALVLFGLKLIWKLV
jgi:threonine/homoserine/homoserine lactone efflux protein